jgi:hypothetical protein
MIKKHIRIDEEKIRRAAHGEECTMQSPWCNHDPETTVLCHLNESFAGKGLGKKTDDTAAFFGCNGPRSCHAWYDSNEAPYHDRIYYAFRAVVRTTRRLIEKGVLHVK